MDECFAESLVYSDSDNSDAEGPEKPEAAEKPSEPITQSSSPEKVTQNQSDDSDEDVMNKSVKKLKKNKRILSSDDDSDNNKNASDEETSNKVTVRPSICDSDTKSSSDDNKEQEVKKVPKKSKKKKSRVIAEANSSDSESDTSSKSNEKKKKTTKSNRKANSSGGSSSGSATSSDSNDGESNATENIKPREKTEQRMSAKMAEAQMKEIQSESQRMARQLHVNIPYHKPKQHSLKEFLSRRSIVQQREQLTSKPIVKAAVAIKMSGEELVQYMDDLKKRNEEAKEFFQKDDEEHVPYAAAEDSDDSDFEVKPKQNDAETEDNAPEVQLPMEVNGEDNEITPSTEKVKPSQAAVETNMDEPIETPQPTTSTETGDVNPPASQAEPNVIVLHTVPTDLDIELDMMSTNEPKPLKRLVPAGPGPKLHGDKGLLIDFETNDLKPIPKTGVEELLSRFVKNAIGKPNPSDTQDVSIFQTETGTLEKHTIHVAFDDKKPNKEPRPGESLFKLRNELGQKIRENREKQIKQRLQKEKEQKENEKELNSEEEEEEYEVSDDEVDDKKECAIEEEAEVAEKVVEDEMDVDEPAEDSNSDDESSEDSDCDELNSDELKKPRKRIITAMDDDSDNETSEQNPPAGSDETQFDAVSQSNEHVSNNNNNNDDMSTILTSQDLSKLESEILQLDEPENEAAKVDQSTKLFEEGHGIDEEIGESQLMALCSGTFATQNLDINSIKNGKSQVNEVNGLNGEIAESSESKAKPAFLSSDEDEVSEGKTVKADKKLKRKKKKKKTLVYSDDEGENEPEEIGEEASEIDDQESVEDEEEDIGEQYVQYDSDENEVEVTLKKKEVRRKASDFVENEAELSESEWGSDDEEEQGMNNYEAELGDADKFDRAKLKDELERIRLREQLDDDAHALRVLTERFIEEEDNGQERLRKFRWQHLNNDNMDEQTPKTDDDVILQNSDDENEAEWRRLRYEREQMLKQQTSDKETTVQERTNVSIDLADQTLEKNVTMNLNATKRISIIKPVCAAATRTASPFLIAQSGLSAGHLSRKSFLNRDSPMLEKLASLSKTGSDGDGVVNTAKGRGNYVFVATEKKDNSKRKSDCEIGGLDASMANPSKKSKIEPQKKAAIRPQTKAFFASLN